MNNIKIKKILKEQGLKFTVQRQAIIEVLMNYIGHVLTAEQIYEKTKEKHPTTNFSTIYRNLEILESAQLIHKISMNGEASKYELIYHDEHHHHFICKNCGKSEVIDFCPLRNVNNELMSKEFVLTDHCFELYGYCEKCMDKRKGSED